ALESLIMRLLASESLEARETGTKLLEESRKVMPIFLERADKPDRGGATTAYLSNTRKGVATLAKKYLPDSYGNSGSPVTLINYWPRNELDLVPHMLYESSNLSLAELEKEVEQWSYDQKLEVFNS